MIFYKKIVSLMLATGLALTQLPASAVLPPITETSNVGIFRWFDLLTNDLEKSRSYYQQLFGWTITTSENHGSYALISNQGKSIGGIAELRNEPDPAWFGLMAVTDINGEIEKVTSLNGKILEKPQDVPNRGVMAILKDNVGAAFVLVQQKHVNRASKRKVMDGDWLWSDLFTINTSASVDFYEKLTGFSKLKSNLANQSDKHIKLEKNSDSFGVVRIPWKKVTPLWLPYVRVGDIDATIKKSQSIGGRLFFRASKAAILIDPTGAAFGIQQITK